MPHYMANGASFVAALAVATLVTVPLVTLSLGVYIWDLARESMAPVPLTERERADVIARIEAINAARLRKP